MATTRQGGELVSQLSVNDLAIYHHPAAVDLRGKEILHRAKMIHSVRSALIGSMDAARRAGTKQAARATSISRAQTTEITTGSAGLTSNSDCRISRVNPRALTTPIAIPSAASLAPPWTRVRSACETPSPG